MTEQQRKIFDEFRKNPHAFPEEHKMSDIQLLKKVDEVINEMSMFIVVEDTHFSSDLNISLETLFYLSGRPGLVGFYILLRFYNQVNILNMTRQEEVARYMGVSVPTFNRYRNALEKLGLITQYQQGHTKYISFNPVMGFDYVISPKDPKGYKVWLDNMRKKVVVLTPKKRRELEMLEKKEQRQLALEGVVEERVQQEREKDRLKVKKREEQKFPNEDYEVVINAFKKYRKIGLIGPEINRAKHAIKQMFLAQRTPKQIIECMVFFSEHQGEEDYRWLHAWTLETVMKKMPEFVAGQLRTRRIGDDIKQV